MLKTAIASLFTKNTKYAPNIKIQSLTGAKWDDHKYYS